MKAVIVYDSVFGNTEKIARAIGAALGREPDVTVVSVNGLSAERLQGLDVLFVGSPTRQFRATPAITAFLAALPDGFLKGMKAAAFDTRIHLKNPLTRFIVNRGGYADKIIAIELIRLGAVQPIPTAGFIVLESEGPVKEGELQRAGEWATNILQD